MGVAMPPVYARKCALVAVKWNAVFHSDKSWSVGFKLHLSKMVQIYAFPDETFQEILQLKSCSIRACNVSRFMLVISYVHRGIYWKITLT